MLTISVAKRREKFMSRLTLLGTGTCQIEQTRRASSVLLQLDQTPILFDCGHGTIQRLLEAGVHQKQAGAPGSAPAKPPALTLLRPNPQTASHPEYAPDDPQP